ncbi:MAG: acyl--CoA ligase, partial [bacterium]|nr:acyl--CoA ligase [bacterium]
SEEQQKIEAAAHPEFLQYNITVKRETVPAQITEPEAYIKIEPNPNYKKDAPQQEKQGNIYLKTSGSTAEPKLVKHTHKNLLQNTQYAAERLCLKHDDRIIIPVPLFHMYGLGAGFLPGIIAGATIELIENANIVKYIGREKEYRPTVSFMTPTLCDMLLRIKKTPSPYRLVVTAGDRISETLFRNFETRFGKLVNLYGSTELGVIATSQLEAPLEDRAIGVIAPLPGVEIRLKTNEETNPETNHETGNIPNEKTGEEMAEILCKHSCGFDAYLDKTGKTIYKPAQENGWFPIKDLGRNVGKEQFRVVGRTGNSINRVGILVAFSEVETIMEQAIEDVNYVIVIAGEEEGFGSKKMIACCEMKPKIKTEGKEIRSRCFDIMLRHMVPDDVRVVEKLPRLPNGKFDRKQLKAQELGS